MSRNAMDMEIRNAINTNDRAIIGLALIIKKFKNTINIFSNYFLINFLKKSSMINCFKSLILFLIIFEVYFILWKNL
tara:strand:+ start:1929 stop:2159 length:231 start_codon:yes stop_codon:yes gene_type:complete